MTALREPFLIKGEIDRTFLMLFLAINLLVLLNNVLHNPVVGYDGTEHLKYIRVLPYRLPDTADTREFFSAPLPYVFPSLIDKACLRSKPVNSGSIAIDNCLIFAGKFAQLINFVLSLGVTFCVGSIARIMQPESRWGKISALALLGVLTVYYKTFTQVRGEPYLILFTAWTLYLVARMIQAPEQVTWRSGLKLGVVIGLALLSRQWGFMLLPALIGLFALVWLLDSHWGREWAKAMTVAALVAFLICGWFYLSLYIRYGTFMAFNRTPLVFSFSNQPSTFYRNTGLKNLLLFKSPIRGTFNNQLFPILYSDTWGDYWGHFVFIQDRSYLGEMGYGNIQQITPYLGRVNAVSMYPSLIFLVGMLTGVFYSTKLVKGDAGERRRALLNIFLLFYLIVSFSLYVVFLNMYPLLDQGDTIKATYMLHVLVVLPILGAEFLEGLRARSPKAYLVSLALLGLVFAHNLPAMITRYKIFSIP